MSYGGYEELHSTGQNDRDMRVLWSLSSEAGGLRRRCCVDQPCAACLGEAGMGCGGNGRTRITLQHVLYLLSLLARTTCLAGRGHLGLLATVAGQTALCEAMLEAMKGVAAALSGL